NANFDMYTARVMVATPPTITSIQPTNLTVRQGQPAAFTVTATGGSLTYQWRLGGSPIGGATASAYSLSNAQCANAGGYHVVVTNVAGSVTSAVVTLTVVSPPGIASQPTNLTVQVGQTATD